MVKLCGYNDLNLYLLSFDLYFYFLQAAVYGLGVCAEFGGSVVKPLVGGIFACIFWRILIAKVLYDS